MNDELRARIVLDVIDIKTGFYWNNNDDVWIEAIKLAFREIREEERKSNIVGCSFLKGALKNE